MFLGVAMAPAAYSSYLLAAPLLSLTASGKLGTLVILAMSTQVKSSDDVPGHFGLAASAFGGSAPRKSALDRLVLDEARAGGGAVVESSSLRAAAHAARGLPMPKVGYKVASIESDALATTSAIGDITADPVTMAQDADLFKYVLRHEGGHRAISPTSGPMWLRTARGAANDFAYENVQFVTFTEELFAETYASHSVKQGFNYADSEIGLTPWRIVAGGATYGATVAGMSYFTYQLVAPAVFGQQKTAP